MVKVEGKGGILATFTYAKAENVSANIFLADVNVSSPGSVWQMVTHKRWQGGKISQIFSKRFLVKVGKEADARQCCKLQNWKLKYPIS